MKVRTSIKKICPDCKLIRQRVCFASLQAQATQAAPGLGEGPRPREDVRISGVDIPERKRVVIALTYIWASEPDGREDLHQGGHQPGYRRACLKSRQSLRGIIEKSTRSKEAAHRAQLQHRAYRHQLLPRQTAPLEPSRPRAAHAHQRAHAQGTEGSSGCRQEKGSAG